MNISLRALFISEGETQSYKASQGRGSTAVTGIYRHNVNVPDRRQEDNPFLVNGRKLPKYCANIFQVSK